MLSLRLFENITTMLLGIDLGSSSVKVSVLNENTGEIAASVQYPKKEMAIIAKQPGWAEQHPDDWYANIKAALKEVSEKTSLKDIKAIGITYQMHGLVCIDKDYKVLRPSIIWCDSRAVEIGNKAFEELGSEKCLSHLFNSPGNFTASKLKWVKDNEPELYEKIYKVMLPGDYIAYKLTGDLFTTISGLSEGMFWDYKNNSLADFLFDYYGLTTDHIPEIVDTFAVQGKISAFAAEELGLPVGVPVTYRAGDQPNNAFSLNVLQPGEIAATAGTSGVVYGISDKDEYDPKSRVNIFAHVNHKADAARYGVLLCINGTGILNSWVKHNTASTLSYEEMNKAAADVNPGSDGLAVIPFGNGAERVIENKNPGCSVHNLNFNNHTNYHLIRAAQEGIAFSFYYGMKIMSEKNGIEFKKIRAGQANMFLSPIFRETIANITDTPIELYNTDGAAGAARGAGLGAGIYKTEQEAFTSLKVLEEIQPAKDADVYKQAYINWENILTKIIL